MSTETIIGCEEIGVGEGIVGFGDSLTGFGDGLTKEWADEYEGF